MKARPRRVENRIAEELTKWSAERGDHWVFTRRPAMGRTGPDIEFPNPYRFVIDVKSRKSISNKPFMIVNKIPNKKVWTFERESTSWYMCRLDNLDSLLEMDYATTEWTSVVVNTWLEHMREWANNNSGVGMIILHKPRKPIGHSVVVMSTVDWLKLMEAMKLL